MRQNRYARTGCKALFSVIIPTLNRANMLTKALGSIDRAAFGHDVEVIVVDNGSNDETKLFVTAYKATNLNIVYESEPEPGVCRAKNKGILRASFDILVFTDDDCQMAADYFTILEKLYAAAEQPSLIGGRVELGDPTDAPITIKTEMKEARYGDDPHESPGGFVHGCNLTMHREVFDQIGCWDERFGPAGVFRAAEDTEIIYRAHKAGISIIYHPDLVMYHYHGRKTSEEIKRLNRSYQFGNGALLALYHDKLLIKLLYWYFINWIKEFGGGKMFDENLCISHGEVVKSQIRGVIRFLNH